MKFWTRSQFKGCSELKRHINPTRVPIEEKESWRWLECMRQSQNLLIALSGSSQTTPNFWLDPRNGVSYPLVAMMPQYDINSLQALANIPVAQSGATTAGSTRTAATTVADSGAPAPQNLLGTLSTLTRATQQAVVSHYKERPPPTKISDIRR